MLAEIAAPAEEAALGELALHAREATLAEGAASLAEEATLAQGAAGDVSGYGGTQGLAAALRVVAAQEVRPPLGGLFVHGERVRRHARPRSSRCPCPHR